MSAVRVGLIDGDEVRAPAVTPTPSIRRYVTRNPLFQDIGVETEVIGEQACDFFFQINCAVHGAIAFRRFWSG